MAEYSKEELENMKFGYLRYIELVPKVNGHPVVNETALALYEKIKKDLNYSSEQ